MEREVKNNEVKKKIKKTEITYTVDSYPLLAILVILAIN
jgi:hypothetical protein